ncbi:MAG: hypothetical protein ACLFMS_01640 [Halorhodospira sp.]
MPVIERAWLEPWVSGLAAYLDPAGRLREPDTADRWTPPDHYAPVFTALALHVHPQLGDWRRPLDAWAALPVAQRGHDPFNRLGLRLLESRLEREGAQQVDRSRVRRALGGCRLRRRYPSNNWTLLAATVRLLEAGTPFLRLRRAEQLATLAERWMTSAGGFVDFPARAKGQIATPVAYHLKALLCLWLAACRVDHPRLHALLERGVSWLDLVATRGGFCGGLGRTNHALYGDACLMTVLGGMLAAQGHSQDAGRSWAELLEAAQQRLSRQRRADGLFWLTPACRSGVDGGWDRYMHLSVYNAWAAGLLSLVADGDQALVSGRTPECVLDLGASAGRVPKEDRESGLLRVDGSDWTVCVSLHGQAIQGYSRSEGDLRSAAGCAFHLEVEGRPVVPPPGRRPRLDWENAPWLAGWLPLVLHQDELYGPLRFERTGWVQTATGLCWWGEGAPVALCRPSASTWRERIRDAIDWRLLGGARQRGLGAASPPLADHSWRVEMTWEGVARRLTARWILSGQPGSAARLLNPGGWALIQASGESGSAEVGAAKGALHCSLGRAVGGCELDPVPWPSQDRSWQVAQRFP